MNDELVKRLREGTNGTDVTKTDAVLTAYMREAADRIEELSNCVAVLEAKLSKSEALLKKVVKMAYEPCPFGYGTEGYYDWWYNRHKLLAELNCGKRSGVATVSEAESEKKGETDA
jgi:hypothetical protein